MIRSMVLTLLLLVHFASTAQSEIIAAEGRAETYVSIKRAGFECEPTARAKCKLGSPCFVTIVIGGPAARALFEAMRTHPVKFDSTAEDSYLGTKDNTMTCHLSNEAYSCYIGFDIVANTLVRNQVGECE